MNRKFRYLPANVRFFAAPADGDGAGAPAGGGSTPPAAGAAPPTTPPAAPAGNDGDQGADEVKKPETDWKAEARKWEQRAKANIKAAEELAKIEDAKKSDLEKATEQIAALTAERDAAKLSVLRAEVAQEAGLPAALAARLTGSDKETLLEDAKALAALVKPTDQTGNQTPPPNTAQGNTRTGKQPVSTNNPTEILMQHYGWN